MRQAPGAGAIEIRPEQLTSQAANLLIAELNAELLETYPEPGATHFRLDPDEVGPGRGVFLVAYENDRPVACGAVRRIDHDAAELKRMYVAPSFRRRGVSWRLLEALEAEARRLGATRLVLETGVRQHAALALYASAGFRSITPYGEYVLSRLSVCLGKALASDQQARSEGEGRAEIPRIDRPE
jgi:GNAT superfamily N-acetyltransferase